MSEAQTKEQLRRDRKRLENARYRAKHPEKGRAWREANPDKVRKEARERMRKLRATNPEILRARDAAYYRRKRERQEAERSFPPRIGGME
jgi:hypothetical protein